MYDVDVYDGALDAFHAAQTELARYSRAMAGLAA